MPKKSQKGWLVVDMPNLGPSLPVERLLNIIQTNYGITILHLLTTTKIKTKKFAPAQSFTVVTATPKNLVTELSQAPKDKLIAVLTNNVNTVNRIAGEFTGRTIIVLSPAITHDKLAGTMEIFPNLTLEKLDPSILKK